MKGQHRRPGLSAGARFFVTLLVVVLVAGAAVGGWYGYRSVRHEQAAACPIGVTLTVAAAPEIAPAVSRLAGTWNANRTAVDGSCVRITVSAVAPASEAAAIAGAAKVSVAGLGEANGDTAIADVWIPDSSTWLARLKEASPEIAMNGVSVATSPVVVALPQPVAASLGAATPTWKTVLAALSAGQLRPGLVDPNVDASGLAALLAVGGAAQSTAGASDASSAQTTTIAAMRAFATGASELRDDLMGRFPRAADPTSIARSLSLAPVPEQSVLAYDAAKPPVPLVGVYLDPAPPALDYPYTQLPGISAEKADAAAEFGALMSGSSWRATLAASDLRAADGTFGAHMPKIAGMPTGPFGPVTPVPGATVDQALSTWSAVTVAGRMLAVIDVSGSMATKVPTAGGATREQVTVAAAKAGLALFDDQWTIGLWTFATNLRGSTDYRKLAPIAPLSTGRSGMLAALSQIEPVPNGDTGLYDTVLAAYKAVQQGWDPRRVNSVVIMTDGENDDPSGITLDSLLKQLKAIKNPAKPVEVIAIGIGTGVSEAELRKITDATGGGTFVTADPSKIGDIFLRAIALRPGTQK
ncbi:MAG TPA: substrate-binding domain-containing protein [Micromonosporaceae bacterium]|nr:substrate-binding domain-containing protein [Micromonosporaceae bacterium]